MGRSGTTIAFEAFSRHPLLAWPSNYCMWMPKHLYWNLLVPLADYTGLRGHKKQYGRALPGNRFLPQPDEAYEFWDCYSETNFSRDYLSNTVATSRAREQVRGAVCALVRWQRKRRFAAKFTGPGRITYLSSIFPDALFIHVIRDGRAVVESLLRQRFWREKGGLDRPFWTGTPDAVLREWEVAGRDSAVLAALQWRHVIQSIRSEASEYRADAYMALRYEDYVADPVGAIVSMYRFSNLPMPGDEVLEQLESHVGMRDMNQKWRNMEKDTLHRITRAMEPLLSELGYV